MAFLKNIVKLYSPMIMSCAVIIFSFFIKYNSNSLTLFDINIGFITFQHISVTSNIFISKIIFVMLAILPLLSYLTYDFTTFFEEYVEMDVYYDRLGLTKSLSAFSSTELKALNIVSENYEESKNKYYKELDDKLIKEGIMQKGDLFFSVKNGVVHSKGSTSFIVKKTKRAIQSYVIKESEGQIMHELNKCHFNSIFGKINSSDDQITLSLSDIYLKHKAILKPHFRQTISVKNIFKGADGHRVLHGLTKINFFPYPKYSNTVYLYENDGLLIPIGYAVYH